MAGNRIKLINQINLAVVLDPPCPCCSYSYRSTYTPIADEFCHKIMSTPARGAVSVGPFRHPHAHTIPLGSAGDAWGPNGATELLSRDIFP
jgi:hypothetical protein